MKENNYIKTLLECIKIARNRQKQYGMADEHLKLVREILDVVFNINLNEKEITLVMVSQKLARAKYNSKSDNIIDCINYLAQSVNTFQKYEHRDRIKN